MVVGAVDPENGMAAQAALAVPGRMVVAVVALALAALASVAAREAALVVVRVTVESLVESAVVVVTLTVAARVLLLLVQGPSTKVDAVAVGVAAASTKQLSHGRARLA